MSRLVSRCQSGELVEVFLDGYGRNSDVLMTMSYKRRYSRPLLFNMRKIDTPGSKSWDLPHNDKLKLCI